MESTPSDRRRRSVRQLLFVIAGAHTGAFAGSALPRFGLPGEVVSAITVLVLFTLPFVVDENQRFSSAHESFALVNVDAKWEYVDPLFEKVMQ
ncbi:hypothetical protein [Halolamina salifodinae]|uniref:Uncharacterized protein n=1 Tax=Halolamina salifodinae TaxID=1202767 RepID=A0A8T4GZ89_9EURY|nr:hypothetical protein [Halolamina salifodinae]MBP1987612.1 hypothetical protein [Halolamina salifodinae]